jgi:hypothetical protein
MAFHVYATWFFAGAFLANALLLATVFTILAPQNVPFQIAR